MRSAPRVTAGSESVAALIARVLKQRGIERVFALCGGHIMPLWMQIDAVGITIIDVRDERAAVHMAQAHAEIVGGLGVALVTAGPGVTNAMTGIANAHVSRAPILVLSGCTPRQQTGRGALQDMNHPALLGTITRYARTVAEPSHALRELDEAIARALGECGEPGPAFLDFPTDTLRAPFPPAFALPEQIDAHRPTAMLPEREAIGRAADLLLKARRPLVVSGRGARRAAAELSPLLDRLDAIYLDTGESRGVVSDEHPSVVASMRGRAMREADLVITVGRRLDFQLAYGSPAVFEKARFVRIADCAGELRDNRRGEVELFGTPALVLDALREAMGDRAPERDRDWIEELRAGHRERAAKLKKKMREMPPGSDGRMHPDRLLAAIQDHVGSDSIMVIDGGDFLSFARIGLSARTMLDPGPFGCIGVGVPYGIAASLARPDTPVVVATGDGAFGFNAIEIDTAVRHRAPVVIIVANNGAWQIEVHDQKATHGKVVASRLQFADHAAMARGFGMHAERVEKAENLDAALSRAFANRPALLDVVVTPEAVSSDARSGLAWVPDMQPLAAWDEAERAWRYSNKGAGKAQ